MTSPIKTAPTMSELLWIRHRVRREKPLIHCVTNPTSMRDCADTLLAVSVRPIMTERPPEAVQTTAQTRALTTNLENVSTSCMEAIVISGRTTLEESIPCVVGVVDIVRSSPRLSLVRDFIRECHPCMVKDNNSELRALTDLSSHVQGVDAGKQDHMTENLLGEHIAMLVQLALDTDVVIACIGAIGLVTDGRRAYIPRNGYETTSLLTGTNCMLDALTASLLADGEPSNIALLTVSYLGVCGGLAQKEYQGPSSFFLHLVDLPHMVTGRQLKETVNYTVYNRGIEHA